MNHKYSFTFIVILGVLSIFGHLSAQTQTKTATLRGKERNLTSGYTIPSQKVTLKIYYNDELKRELQTMTNTDGEYGFTNLNYGKKWTYQLHTQYKDVDYVSRRIRLTGYREHDIYNLSVYSIGSDDSEIFIEAHHLVLNIAKKDQVGEDLGLRLSEKNKEWLEVTEYLIVQNTGNRCYLSDEPMPQSIQGGKVSLKLNLPIGYRGLEILRGISPYQLFLKPNSIFYGDAIKPGTFTLAFKYLIEISQSIELSRELSFDTEKVLVISAEPRISIDSNLQKVQTRVEREQRTYLGKTYKKGDSLDLKVKIAPPVDYSKKIGFYALISVLIICAGFGAYLGYKKFILNRNDIVKKAQKFDKSPVSEEEKYLSDLKTIYLELIFLLDEMRGEGKIDDRAYQSLHEETEEKLRYVFSEIGG